MSLCLFNGMPVKVCQCDYAKVPDYEVCSVCIQAQLVAQLSQLTAVLDKRN